MKKDYKIAVAGTGYVGLSIATLLSQHHQVTAVDIIPEKVDMINNRKSPIQDDYIEKYLAEKELNLTAKPIIIETQRFEDFRGWLSVSAEEFHVVQINQGFSKKAGTLRGLHFQERSASRKTGK